MKTWWLVVRRFSMIGLGRSAAIISAAETTFDEGLVSSDGQPNYLEDC